MVVLFIIQDLNHHCGAGSKPSVIVCRFSLSQFVDGHGFRPACGEKPNTGDDNRRFSASSSNSLANQIVHCCYACKEESTLRDFQLLEFDGDQNPMFMKPFHRECVPTYYRYKDDIEKEREDERTRAEKEQPPGYRPPNMRIMWGRVSPRLINQPEIRQLS